MTVPMSQQFKSAIYTGRVRHRRCSPKEHAFSYRVFMVYCDLSELEQLVSLSTLWTLNKPGLARFCRKDFHGDPRKPLAEAVKDTVEAQLGWRPKGAVRMLANWRYFGYNMNPLTTYYCFDTCTRNNSEHLVAILAEVTNTPWGERHAYALACDSDKEKQCFEFDKAFTVSPFNPVNMRYRWLSNTPGEALYVHIDTEFDGERRVDATMTLKRIPMSGAALNRILIRYPLMTVKVISAIYWQALVLFLKGIPFLGKGAVEYSKVVKKND